MKCGGVERNDAYGMERLKWRVVIGVERGDRHVRGEKRGLKRL